LSALEPLGVTSLALAGGASLPTTAARKPSYAG